MTYQHTRDNVRDWAAPVRDQIDDDTADTIARLWDQVAAVYATDDPDDPDTLGSAEASTGAAMYALGDTTVATAGKAWRSAQIQAATAQDQLIGVIIAALDAGATRQAICTQLGIARTTLNRWIAEP